MDVIHTVQVVTTLLAVLLFVRFWFQLVRVDYFNPAVQLLLRITQPVTSVFEKIIPTIGTVNCGVLVCTHVVLGARAWYISQDIGVALVYPFMKFLMMGIDILVYAILASVVVSWIAPRADSPYGQLIVQITAPLFAAVRKFVPTLGMFDFSPIVLLLVFSILKSLIRGTYPMVTVL